MGLESGATEKNTRRIFQVCFLFCNQDPNSAHAVIHLAVFSFCSSGGFRFAGGSVA